MEEGDCIGCEWLPVPEEAEGREFHLSTDGSEVAINTGACLNEACDNDGASSIQMSVGLSVGEAERMLIEATLKECNFHKEKAAAILGISLKTLYNRIKEYESSGDNGSFSTQLR